MDSVPDILGLTHIAVTSVVQLVVTLKRQVCAYRSLWTILNSAEEKSLRIRSSLSSLELLAKIEELDSSFFAQTLEEVQEIERELVEVQRDVESNSKAKNFLSATRISERAQNINRMLSTIERSLQTVGMIGEIVTRKVESECTGLGLKLDEVGKKVGDIVVLLNHALSSSSPLEATVSVLNNLKANNPGILDHQKARPRIQDLLAAEDEAHLYFLLGRSHYLGEKGGEKNYYRATRFLLAAFNKGSFDAAFYIGKLYYAGDGVNRCFKTAFDYFSVGARNGDGKAMTEVGWCLEFGHGASIDCKQAVKYYNRAAEQGVGSGLWLAGYHALHGNATRQNWPKAFRLLEAGRAAGELRSNCELSHFYENGIHVEKDERRAFELRQEAYDSGLLMATHYLARCYQLGIGVEQDHIKAAALYRELMERGTWLGKLLQVYYGQYLIRGLGVQRNVARGLGIIRRGLKPGFGCGWSVYGDCYRHGYGVKRDIVKAITCYSKAIASSSGQRGVLEAHFALAEMYETGDGLVRNYVKAAHHYISAADRMSRVAQWKVGSFFYEGVGVEKHIHRAFVYFHLSARSGHVLAQRKAGELYMKGLGIQRDRTKAVHLLKEAANQGDVEAKKLLRRAQFANLMFWKRRKTI